MAIFFRLSIAPILVYGAAEALARGLNLLALPLLTHFFSVSEYGQIALLTSLVGMVGLFANCGLSNAAHRFYFDAPANESCRNEIISAGFFGVVFLSGASIVLSIGIIYTAKSTGLWNIGQIPIALLAIVSVMPLQILQYGQDVMRLYSAHWRYFFVAVFRNIVVISIALALVVYFNTGVLGYFIGVILGNIVLLPLVMFGLNKAVTRRPNSIQIKRLVRYGYPFIFVGMAQLLISSIDMWMLGMLKSDADVGFYSIGIKLASMVSFVNTAFSLAWSPQILRLQAEDQNYREKVGQILIRLIALLVFAAASISILVPHIFTLFFPEEYGSLTVVVSTLSFSVAIIGTAQITGLGMIFEKRSDMIAKATWIVAFISVVTSATMVSLFGLLGAAISNLTTSLTLTLVYFFVTQRIHSLVFNKKEIINLIFQCAVIFTTCIILNLFANSTLTLFGKLSCLIVLFVWLYRKGKLSNILQYK